jgi:hypothetical protein
MNRAVPKVRRQNLLTKWLDTEPDVPEGRWYKRFSGMTIWGEGDLIKTFSSSRTVAEGRARPVANSVSRLTLVTWPLTEGCVAAILM